MTLIPIGCCTKAFGRMCRARGAVALAMMLCAAAVSAAAQEEAAPKTHTFRLQHKPEGFSLDIPVDLEGSEVAFQKEPEYIGRKIIRGALPVGRDAKGFIGFALDESAATLYLDLNRNLDLTDDPEGIYEGDDTFFFAEIEGVHVTLDSEAGPVPYALAIELYNGYFIATVRSGWHATVDINGKTRTFSVVDNLDGVIDGNDRFVLGPSDDDAFPDWDEHVSASRLLMLNGQAYETSFGFEGEELVATFTESEPPLGELELEGDHIARLILCGERDAPTVVIDSPAKLVPIPAGAYDHQQVYLDAGDTSGPFYASSEKPVSVTEGDRTSLKLGGPLNNTVGVTRSGRTLHFEYRLEGIGGEIYDDYSEDSDEEPELIVYKDGQKVTSGTFEYG